MTDWPEMIGDDLTPMAAHAGSGLEVYEDEGEVVVKANVAGVPEKEIDVTFEKGVLKISAKAAKEEQDEKRTHYARSSWEYAYTVAVPGMIDFGAEPKAEVDNGVVMVRFPKAKAALPKKLTVSKKSAL
jgi:HSP20 family protein